MTGQRGVAVQMLRITRVARALERHGPRLLRRTLCGAERAYCEPRRHAAQHVAVRLAAKFATRRLLGGGARLNEIEVVRDAAGAPGLALHGAALRAAGPARLLVSLSHDADLAVALVVVETVEGFM